MPTLRTKGKVQLSTQLDAALVARLREYSKGRRETLTEVLERAISREMAYPPPIPEQQIEPLPDAAPAPAARRATNSHTKRKT